MSKIAVTAVSLVLSSVISVCLALPEDRVCPLDNLSTDYTPLTTDESTLSATLNRTATRMQELQALLNHFEDLRRTLDSSELRNGSAWLCEPTDGSGYFTIKSVAMQWKTPTNCVYVIHPDNPPLHFSEPQDLFHDIRAFHRAIRPLGYSVSKSYGLPWSKCIPPVF